MLLEFVMMDMMVCLGTYDYIGMDGRTYDFSNEYIGVECCCHVLGVRIS